MTDSSNFLSYCVDPFLTYFTNSKFDEFDACGYFLGFPRLVAYFGTKKYFIGDFSNSLILQ